MKDVPISGRMDFPVEERRENDMGKKKARLADGGTIWLAGETIREASGQETSCRMGSRMIIKREERRTSRFYFDVNWPRTVTDLRNTVQEYECVYGAVSFRRAIDPLMFERRALPGYPPCIPHVSREQPSSPRPFIPLRAAPCRSLPTRSRDFRQPGHAFDSVTRDPDRIRLCSPRNGPRRRRAQP